jgi:soluble lytic murein transglycosylase-like protein
VLKVIPVVAALLALSGCGSGPEAGPTPGTSPPASPHASLPRDPAGLARELASTTERLRAEIEAWTGRARGAPPRPVTLLALHQQRIYRRLESDRGLGARVLARLPRAVAPEARDTLAARRALAAIPASGSLHPRIRIAAPEPAGRLRRFYLAAERRFGVPWPMLAAVNFVESSFGRLRNESTAGARGPMQFIPATWRAYGLGGDIEDPHDAILGAANYLHANGAPARMRQALLAYNHSTHYVEGVSRFASRIRRDPRAFYEYYAWEPFIH